MIMGDKREASSFFMHSMATVPFFYLEDLHAVQGKYFLVVKPDRILEGLGKVSVSLQFILALMGSIVFRAPGRAWHRQVTW